MLLDEPSASLDEMAEAHLIEQLKQWIGHRTLIIATHRTAMLQLVDRIIVMDQGRIVMDGAKEAICVNRANPRRDGWCCRRRIRGLPHERTTAIQPWPD